MIPWFSTPFSLLFEHPRGSEQGTPATPTSSTPEIQAWFWSGKPLLLALLFELALVFFLLKQRALVNFLSFAVIFFIKMAPTNQVSYHKDEKVLCFHHEILYEAKILDVRQTDPDDKKSPFEYAVHYKGWKSTYVLLLPPILWIHSFFRSLHVYYYDQCPPWVLDTLPYLMITPEILPLELLPFSSSREIERNHHSPVTMRMNSYWRGVQVDGMTGSPQTVSGNLQTRTESWRRLFVVRQNRPSVRETQNPPPRDEEVPTAAPPVAARNDNCRFLVAGPREVEIMRLKRFVSPFLFF